MGLIFRLPYGVSNSAALPGMRGFMRHRTCRATTGAVLSKKMAHHSTYRTWALSWTPSVHSSSSKAWSSSQELRALVTDRTGSKWAAERQGRKSRLGDALEETSLTSSPVLNSRMGSTLPLSFSWSLLEASSPSFEDFDVKVYTS